MTDIEWGAEIHGPRPDWLADDGQIVKNKFDSELTARNWLENFSPYRLPADHDYYKATSRGFTYWPGGESAPADWDGSPVLLRDGEMWGHADATEWQELGGRTVIGYRKRTEQPAPAIAPELVERAFSLLREIAKDGKEAKFEGHGVYFAARKILDALNPIDPDLTLAKSIVGDAEAIALAIKAARENGRG